MINIPQVGVFCSEIAKTLHSAGHSRHLLFFGPGSHKELQKNKYIRNLGPVIDIGTPSPCVRYRPFFEFICLSEGQNILFIYPI